MSEPTYYYIISLKHSEGARDIMFWRPECNGYAGDDLEEIGALHGKSQDSFAIPCEEVEEFIHRAVDAVHLRKLREIAVAVKEPTHG